MRVALPWWTLELGLAGDGEAFRAAGYRFLGVDLATGNARLAAEANLRVIQGSLTALPVRSSAFDAGWSLSTLMHLDEAEAALAVNEMFRTLRPFAPFVVGVWGRESEALVSSSSGTSGYRRPFHLRSFERNGRLLTSQGDLEASVRWEAASGDWDYQVFGYAAPGDGTHYPDASRDRQPRDRAVCPSGNETTESGRR